MRRKLRLLPLAVAFLSVPPAVALPPEPVIFVHGLNSNEGAWAAIADAVGRSGWQFGGCPSYSPITTIVSSSCTSGNVLTTGHYYRMKFSSNEDLTLEEQGEQLGAIIDAVTQLNGAPSVIVVAHSMGGLAARHYMQFIEDGKVSRLITVGTPHLGAEWADLCQSVEWGTLCALIGINPFSVAVDEIEPGSAALDDLNDLASHPLPSGSTFVSILGTGRPVLSQLGQDGDGVVTLTSQNLASVGEFAATHFEYPLHIGGCGALSILQTHTCETRDPLVWEKVIHFTESAIFAGDFEEGVPVAWVPSDETSAQPGPEAADVWITSHFDYDDDYGVNDDRLIVGGWADSYYALILLDVDALPATAEHAELRMYVRHNPGQSTFVPMQLHRVTSAWDEDTGWPNRPSTVLIRNLPAPVVEGWYYIDVTDLYNGWKSGTFPNLGIELRPTSTSNRFNVFRSSDYSVTPSQRPKLVVVPAS